MYSISDILDIPEWCKAIALTERPGILGRVGNSKLPDHQRELAEKRLQGWRSQFPIRDDSAFARRLSADGLTEDDLRAHLILEPAELRELLPAPPEWQETLAAIFSEDPGGPPCSWPAEVLARPDAGFLPFLEPWVRWLRRRLLEELESCPDRETGPFQRSGAVHLLLADLPSRLLPILGRTLVLELHISRLQGNLDGETPEARFRSFAGQLSDRRRALDILREYPVLARQLTVAVGQWLENGVELLLRLSADWEEIRRTFCGGADPGRLERVRFQRSDPHRGGRSVGIVRFSSGLRLVYKPKSLGPDQHFQDLLGWLNDRGHDPPFRLLSILVRDGYGWMEYVSFESCDSRAQVERYYRRMGAFLALLYVLEASDIHYQNLIAAGEHPILVDLEGLFHVWPQGRLSGPERLAMERLERSVLRVGLLPVRNWQHGDGEESVDVGGLTALSQPLGLHAMPVATERGTDTMRYERRRMRMEEGWHRPRLGGEEKGVGEFQSEILAGFTAAYHELHRNRSALLDEEGPLAPFANCEVRRILRPTRVYSLLLDESYHPRLLRDALGRDRFFDRLWVDVDANPHLEKIIAAERRDLWRNDIPLFTAPVTSRHLTSSDGECIRNFFPTSGWAQARQRLEELGDEDLGRQRWLVRASLAMQGRDSPGTADVGTSGPTDPRHWKDDEGRLLDRADLVRAACDIAEYLESLSIRADSRSTWLGFKTLPDGSLSFQPLEPELYSGLSGIVLFLANLGAVVGEGRFKRLAGEAWRHARSLLAETAKPSSVGAFAGWGSLLYTATCLARLWQDQEYLEQAQAMVEDLAARVDEDLELDVIGGAAGAIVCLLRLYRLAPADRTLAVAMQCGERLLRGARPMTEGLAWLNRASGRRPLSGFAHGVAGVSWALAELAQQTGERRFLDAARGALEYERGSFSPTTRNWIDLRYFDEHGRPDADAEVPTTLFPAWCHGAAGIALSRALIFAHLKDEHVPEEIRTSLNLVLTRGFGHNHCLCHGDLGNLDILLQVSQILDDADLRRKTESLAASLLEGRRLKDWRYGSPGGIEHPGLMTGLAGIGYGLLRLADPDGIPSVLSLA